MTAAVGVQAHWIKIAATETRGWLAANGRLSDAGQVVPLSTAVIHAGAVPFPNPIGLTRRLDTATE